MIKLIRCAILFSGNGSNMQHLIQTLHNKTFYNQSKEEVRLEISLTLCNNEHAYGIKRAKSLNIPCKILPHHDFHSREAFEKAMSDILYSYEINYIFLAGFMRILTSTFTQKFSIINIHPSFLPEYKGAHAIKNSFEGNSNYGGVSVHWVNEELDSGKIILQKKVAKYPSDTLQDFEHRIHACEYALYPHGILKALGLKQKDRDE